MAKTKTITVKMIDNGKDSTNVEVVNTMLENDYVFLSIDNSMEFKILTFTTKKRIPAGELNSLQRKLRTSIEDKSIEVAIE